jgi:hypothetical protein
VAGAAVSFRGPDRYRVVTICGSMRFKAEMLEAADRLSRQGFIVLMPFCTFAPEEQLTSHDKTMLDRMHFTKIDMSDSIYVVNVGGYVGNSTANELRYAELSHKTVYYLEGPA